MSMDIKPISAVDNKVELTSRVNLGDNTTSFSDTLYKFYALAPESSLNKNDTQTIVLFKTANGNVGNTINLMVDETTGKINHTPETLCKILSDTKPLVKINSSDLNTFNSTNIHKIEFVA